jgi:putative ATP-dependent endonuclease of OLD family
MHIEEIRIENFCSCASLHMPLSDFNPIIGYNNSGKSNVLRAISWMLRKYVLQESSFHNRAHPVIVEALVSSVNVTLLPANQQTQVAPFVQNGNIRFRRRQDAPGVAATQVRIEVFNPNTQQWANNPTGLDNAIAVLFPDPLYIQAMDDAADDVSRFAAKNTIGLLLKLTLDRIRANNLAALANIQQDLQSVSDHLNGPTRIQELNNLESQATTAIGDFFPGLNLHLDIQTPTFDELIKGATISLSDHPGFQRPFTSFGHGAQRTVQMALIKLLAAQVNQQAQQGATTVLLIDEPELYLHPQAIELLRESLKLLSTQNFQVIFSTHSPLLLGSKDVLNTSIMYKNAGGTVVRQKLANAAQTIAANPHHASVVFSIQNATYLMFSEKVILVEGKTEMMLVPDLFRMLSGQSLAQGKACLVETSSSSAIAPMLQVLTSVGFQPKAVVDLDFVFKTAPQNGLVSAQDPDYAACKNWFAANQACSGFALGTDGFPARKDSAGNVAQVLPEQAFELMAAAMPTQIGSLANQLLSKRVWVWQRGAIEAHLGIALKNDVARMNFLVQLNQNQDVNHAAHPADVAAFVNWLKV